MVSKRILLVDDEPQLLDVCREGLAGAGYEVLTASNGEAALAALAATPVDLVVSDMKMPRLGGLELLKKIKERGLGAAVIFLTGYGTIENAVECLQHGAADYLLKPFDFGLLFAKIEKVFQERLLKRYDTAVGDLLHILTLNRDLQQQDDEPGLLKKFLQHVKKTFAPDALVYYLFGDGRAQPDPFFTWGPFFGDPERVRWFASLAGGVLRLGQPKLIDPQLRRPGEAPQGPAPFDTAALSALAAPVHGFFGKDGVVAVVRANGKPPYSLADLQLFSIFVTHAGSAAGFHRSCRHIQQMNTEMIASFVQAVEAKDFYTKGHSERVRDYSVRLARHMGLAPREQEDISSAALLHDIGKIGIPDGILNKPGRLTGDGRAVMSEHPAIAGEILAGVQSLRELLPVIVHHHEHFDGTGYPAGLRGESIPKLSRIIQVADGFEAMTSNRAYQRSRTAEEALRVLAAGAGSQWDPRIVKCWIDLVGHSRDLLALGRGKSDGEAPGQAAGVS